MITLDVKAINSGLRKIAQAIKTNITLSCRQGVDMYGNEFKKYSPEYAERKAFYLSNNRKKNMAKNRKKVETVNLKRTGVMLQSIAVGKHPEGYELTVSDKNRAKIAFYHHTGTGQPERKFFGVSPENERKFYSTYMKNIPLLRKA
jgi:hypothetical protein